MLLASGRGAVPGVEAVERARAERRELVDLFLLACVVFVVTVRASRSRATGASGALTVLVKRVAPLPARRPNPGPVDGRSHTVHGSRRLTIQTPAGEACATPASFVWRFQAALNALGGFLAGSALGHGSLVDE